MPHERYYCPQQLVPDAEITLDGVEFHHLANVMRTKENDTVEIANGSGVLAEATVITIAKKHALLSVKRIIEQQKCDNYSYILCQAIPRLNRLDAIIEKSTELGVAKIVLFPAERSERGKINDHQHERIQGQAIAAMKQCGRLWLPKVSIQTSLKECIDQMQRESHFLLFGDIALEAEPLYSLVKKQEVEKGYAVFIGPESGFSDKEIELLKKCGKGVKLHANILRTDTAAIAACSMLAAVNELLF